MDAVDALTPRERKYLVAVLEHPTLDAAATGAYLKKTLEEALENHTNVGEVRGEGLLCAIEFVEDKVTRRFFDPAGKIGPQVAAALLARGVIARAMPQGDILGLAPPLCLTRREADEIVGKTSEAVQQVFAAR